MRGTGERQHLRRTWPSHALGIVLPAVLSCSVGNATGAPGADGAPADDTGPWTQEAGPSTAVDAGKQDAALPHDERDASVMDAALSQPKDAGVDAGASGHDTRPNIVILLADDMGFSDLHSYGGEIQTPNIDRLANEGLRFTNFYNTARCSPTRASLLTGQYPHRVNLAVNGRELGRNGVTIAEALGAAGYNTAMSGKWHLSQNRKLADAQKQTAWMNHQLDPGLPFANDMSSYPVGRGFLHHFGIIWGVANYFDPFSLVEDTEAVSSVASDFYLTNAIAGRAAEYVASFSAQEKPFFLYVAFTAPHWPLHAPAADIARYEGMYDMGFEKIRQARYDRQIAAGLFHADNAPLPAYQGNAWTSLNDTQKRFLANAMQTHAAMVDRLDQGVGKIIAALSAAGELDNTLIFMLSDNGASDEVEAGAGDDRPSQTRAGQTIVYCGGQAPCPYDQPGSQTTFASIAKSWANVANTPFRYWKADSFRGGNSTPLIVHWPRGLKTEPGSLTEQSGHVIDILPTALEVAHASYPANYGGHAITSLDGLSLLPILSGKQGAGHDALYFEHEGGAAMIQQNYKLVRLKGGNWELYDLAKDRTETHNLAPAQPERLAAMTSAWQTWYASVPH